MRSRVSQRSAPLRPIAATADELRVNEEMYWGLGNAKLVVSRTLLVELGISVSRRMNLGSKTNRQWRDTCSPMPDESPCRLEWDFQVPALRQ